MTKDEALYKVKGYLTDIIPEENYLEVEEIIKALEQESKIGWIPVSERLPNDDGDYLVCMTWDSHKMDVLMWADGWNCVRLFNGEVDRSSEIDGTDILAWMPLPEPYKGGEDE